MLQGAGALFGLFDPFKRVYDYLKSVKETHEVQNQLKNVLQSLNLYADSTKASENSAKALSAKIDSLDPPDVYDFMNFFGRNYDPKTASLDLTNLPILFRLYGPKIEWKESDELSRKVAEGRGMVSRAMEKARAISRQRPVRIKNRHLIIEYVRSLQRLGREGRRLRSHKKTERELWGNAPSWFVELIEIAEMSGRLCRECQDLPSAGSSPAMICP